MSFNYKDKRVHREKDTHVLGCHFGIGFHDEPNIQKIQKICSKKQESLLRKCETSCHSHGVSKAAVVDIQQQQLSRISCDMRPSQLNATEKLRVRRAFLCSAALYSAAALVRGTSARSLSSFGVCSSYNTLRAEETAAAHHHHTSMSMYCCTSAAMAINASARA